MHMAELLANLGATHHHGRIQTMLDIGRRSGQEPELLQLLQRMREKGPYLRHMALYGAVAAKDGQALADTAVHDPSRFLRSMAVRQAARLSNDEQILQMLNSLARKQQRQLLVCLQKSNRQRLVDVWLDSQTVPSPELLAPRTDLAPVRRPVISRGLVDHGPERLSSRIHSA